MNVISLESVAERLYVTRRRAGLDAAQMADFLGVTPNTISSWESGKTSPKARYAVEWADIVNAHDPRHRVDALDLDPDLDAGTVERLRENMSFSITPGQVA